MELLPLVPPSDWRRGLFFFKKIHVRAIFLSLPLDAWTCFISIQNTIFWLHAIPSEKLMNESVTSIFLDTVWYCFQISLCGCCSSALEIIKLKLEPYFDMICPEKHTKNQAAKLVVAMVAFLCFLILIPLIQRVIQFKNSQLCTVLILLTVI